MDHDGQRWITINDGHDERAEWICGILVLGGAARPQGHSGCFDDERQQHESREVRECVGESELSVIRGCGYPIGTRVSYLPVSVRCPGWSRMCAGRREHWAGGDLSNLYAMEDPQ